MEFIYLLLFGYLFLVLPYILNEIIIANKIAPLIPQAMPGKPKTS